MPIIWKYANCYTLGRAIRGASGVARQRWSGPTRSRHRFDYPRSSQKSFNSPKRLRRAAHPSSPRLPSLLRCRMRRRATAFVLVLDQSIYHSESVFPRRTRVRPKPLKRWDFMWSTV